MISMDMRNGMQPTESPLRDVPGPNGREAEADFVLYLDESLGFYYLHKSVIGLLSDMDGELRTLTTRQFNQLKGLAVSKVWRHELRRTHPAYYIPAFLTKDALQSLKSVRGYPEIVESDAIFTIEELITESQSLSLEDKLFETLNNVDRSASYLGERTNIEASLDPYPGTYSISPKKGQSLFGLAYGTDLPEALIVLRLLADRGFILLDQLDTLRASIAVTPSGYLYLDEKSRRTPRIDTAFLVCRFTDVLDDIYDSVYSTVGDHESLPGGIKRIKDIHFIDKIDDKILSEIARASLVIVDLTEFNFNIGFEAGYALSLKKPIIWTMMENENCANLPFDIQSQNIIMYKNSDLPAFSRKLVGRIQYVLEMGR